MKLFDKPLDKAAVRRAYDHMTYAMTYLGDVGQPTPKTMLDDVRYALRQADDILKPMLKESKKARETIELGDFVAVAGETPQHLWDVFRLESDRTIRTWVGEMHYSAIADWKLSQEDE